MTDWLPFYVEPVELYLATTRKLLQKMSSHLRTGVWPALPSPSQPKVRIPGLRDKFFSCQTRRKRLTVNFLDLRETQDGVATNDREN